MKGPKLGSDSDGLVLELVDLVVVVILVGPELGMKLDSGSGPRAS